MKITICGSMSLSKRMVEIEGKLLELGHVVVLPQFTHEYAQMETLDKVHTESARNKIEHDLIRAYFDEIRLSDAVLIINEDKNNIKNYIGGNAFLEMGFAHILNKPIYLINPMPEMSYTDELFAMQPIILNGDLSLIN